MSKRLSLLSHDLLRTLVTIADHGNHARAAEMLFITQAAVSLQMRRLEEQTEQTLFQKSGRNVTLTENGELLLGYARRLIALNLEASSALKGLVLDGKIRLGAPQDFAERMLPQVLKRFNSLYPKVQIDVRIERNLDIMAGIQKRAFDVAMLVNDPESIKRIAEFGRVHLLAKPKIEWIASEDWRHQSNSPIPLVLLEPPCIFRHRAIEALKSAQLTYRSVYVTSSVSGLRAAVEAGLGISARMLEPWDADRGIKVIEHAYSEEGTFVKLPKMGKLSSVLFERMEIESVGQSKTIEAFVRLVVEFSSLRN